MSSVFDNSRECDFTQKQTEMFINHEEKMYSSASTIILIKNLSSCYNTLRFNINVIIKCKWMSVHIYNLSFVFNAFKII